MIYLDNAATTKVSDGVAQVIASTLTDSFANPSSLYKQGLDSRRVLDQSRVVIAKALGCKADEVYFTACGTESNNIAILGAARARKNWGNRVVVTGFEHPSVQNTVASLADEGFEVVVIPPKADGSIDTEQFLAAVDKKTVLCCAMRVNNEIGTLIDTPALARRVKAINSRTAFHCDAVQAFMKHQTLLDGSIDTLSVSAHKLHGPKGIGALYVRNGFNLKRTQFGGGQEKGLRSGTENIAFAAGFARAVTEAGRVGAGLQNAYVIRDYLLNRVSALDCCRVNSPSDASPYILNFSLKGFRSETVLHYLESLGVLVSSGSACSHGARSRTLTAMGLEDEVIDGAIRVSFDNNTTLQEVTAAADAIESAVNNLKRK